MKCHAQPFVILRAALYASLVLGLGGAVSASPPIVTTFTLTEVEGDSVIDWQPLPSGGAKIDLIYIHNQAAGDWVGDWEHSGFITLNPNGVFFAFAFATFSGTIAGHEGTVDIVVHTQGYLPPDGSAPIYSSKFTILQGTGGLATLRGEGTEDTYGLNTARIHFDP